MIEIFSDGTYGGTRVVMDGRWELKCIRSFVFNYDYTAHEIPVLNLEMGMYGLSRGTCDPVFEEFNRKDYLHYVRIYDTQVTYAYQGEELKFTILDVVAEHPTIEFACA